jgi:hypothetical protein
MKKKRLHRCFVCWHGEDCGSRNEKLPRQKKKTLKKAGRILELIAGNTPFWMDVFTSCHQRGIYRLMRPIIDRLGYYQRYLPVILHIHQLADNAGEEIQLDINGGWKLGWHWEYDNGLYTEEGIMPFQFGDDPEDDTWCWSETRNLCEALGLDILKIKNEAHFLKLAYQKTQSVKSAESVVSVNGEPA